MPLHKCTKNGKSGYRWGSKGVCFTGPGAKKKALKQGYAIDKDKFAAEATQEEMDMALGIQDSFIDKVARSVRWENP